MVRKFFDILIIIGLFIGAYFLYTYFFENFGLRDRWTYDVAEKPKVSYAEMKEKQDADARADTEIYNSALESKDREMCESIKNEGEKIRCRDMVDAGIALGSRNIEACDVLSNTGIVLRCRDNIYFAIAESSDSPLSCGDISDENLRFQCVESIDGKHLSERIASGTLSQEYCETLSESIKIRCVARMARMNDSDLYQRAIASKSFDDCDAILEEKLRHQCRDVLIFEKSIQDNDSDLCDNISDPKKIEYCKKSLMARLEKQDYTTIITSGDIKACERLSTTTLHHQCHDVIMLSIVRRDQDGELCDTLYNTGMIENCRALIREQK